MSESVGDVRNKLLTTPPPPTPTGRRLERLIRPRGDPCSPPPKRLQHLGVGRSPKPHVGSVWEICGSAAAEGQRESLREINDTMDGKAKNKTRLAAGR
jgi:hypothetical protein